jgi:hypothetical protein
MGYKSPNLITCTVQCTNLAAPVDSTDYFVGMQSDNPATGGAQRNVYFPQSGRVIAATICINSTTATGTAEDIVMVLRLNDTTDYALATVGVASSKRVFRNLAMNVPVLTTDFYEIKVTTPVWVTNPQGWKIYGYLVIATD